MGRFTGINQQQQLDQGIVVHHTPDNDRLVVEISRSEIVLPVRKTGKCYIDDRNLKCPCKTGTENLGLFSTDHFHGIVPCSGIMPDQDILNQVNIRYIVL